jgi:AcrR family transcriptional regulator
MSRVNTKDRILQAALKLFAEQGYQKTSIARIETEAGLVPRAGAFYRHFDSKETLLEEVARSYISETPERFALDKLADFGDTRSELIAIARNYEAASLRQQPYARLIEEVRVLDLGGDLQNKLDADMMQALTAWIRTKPAANGLSNRQITALVISVIGGWLFYLSTLRRSPGMESLRDTVLDEWATKWSSMLDTPSG